MQEFTRSIFKWAEITLLIVLVALVLRRASGFSLAITSLGRAYSGVLGTLGRL